MRIPAASCRTTNVLPNIFFRAALIVINQQLHRDRLIGAGDHQTCAGFRQKIIRRLSLSHRSSNVPSLTCGRLYTSQEPRAQAGIVCPPSNFLRKRMRERCNLTRGTTQAGGPPLHQWRVERFGTT